MLTCFNVQKTHNFLNTVHYCSPAHYFSNTLSPASFKCLVFYKAPPSVKRSLF